MEFIVDHDESESTFKSMQMDVMKNTDKASNNWIDKY